MTMESDIYWNLKYNAQSMKSSRRFLITFIWPIALVLCQTEEEYTVVCKNIGTLGQKSFYN